MPVNAFTAPPDRICKHLFTTPPESKSDPDVIDWVIETFVETGSSLRLGFCAASKYYCFRNRAHHPFRELFGVAQPPPMSVPQSTLSPEQTLPAVLSGFV